MTKQDNVRAHAAPVANALEMLQPSTGNLNPHFEDLIEESERAIIPGKKYEGQNLWKIVRKFEDDFIVNVKDMPDEERKANDECEETMGDEFGLKMGDIRTAFRGVREPNGWPISLRELHCDLCDRWHTNFRYENLHPLFRFLEDAMVCFSGYGSKLMFHISIVTSATSPKTCWQHSAEEAVNFARHLRKAYEALNTDGVGQEPWLRYPATKLVTIDEHVIEDESGLTLDKVVPFILRSFWEHLRMWREECYEIEANKVEVTGTGRRNMTLTFRQSMDDWVKQKDTYSTIAEIWDGALLEIDETIMRDVAMWKPILKEDMEIRECVRTFR